MNAKMISLWAAYLLLVGLSVFGARQNQQVGERIENDLCQIVQLNLLIQSNILEAVDAPQQTIDSIADLLIAVETECPS